MLTSLNYMNFFALLILLQQTVLTEAFSSWQSQTTSIVHMKLPPPRISLPYMSQGTNEEEEENFNENDTSPGNIADKPYIQIAKDEIVGIGGKRGYTYDINKLKKNLVQTSVKQFKKDLLQLLINNPSKYSKRKRRQILQQKLNIEEKLAALISSNPVATTTDSNLLDGTWELAFSTNNAVEILDEARFIYSRKDQSMKQRKASQNWKLNASAGGKLENPLHNFQRVICLEDLDNDEDPFMMDTISLFRGLWTIQRFYDVVGLSRTSLEIVPDAKIICFCGRQISFSRADISDAIPLTLQFIYLDVDICVSMSGDDKNNLQVYTKNEEWIKSRKQNNHVVSATLSWLSELETPLHIRRRIGSFLGKQDEEDEYFDGEMHKLTEEEYEVMLKRVYDDKESKLLALRIGSYGKTLDDDEAAWNGKDDPFVHLTADERQSIMKQMSIGEIKQAGQIQRRFAKKQKRRRSSKTFVRPVSPQEEGQS